MKRFPDALMLAMLAGAVLGLPGVAAGFSSGPPDGVAGEPPAKATCVLCHSSFPVNSGDGQLELLDVPKLLQAGQPYDVTLRLQDNRQMRWGFELTVLDGQNQAAGTLEVTDALHTQLSDNPGSDPDYLKHTSEGTFPGTPGPTEWTFRWTPDSTAPATFYVVGNAANGDGSPGDDYIYAVQVTAGTATPVEATTWGRIKRAFGPS